MKKAIKLCMALALIIPTTAYNLNEETVVVAAKVTGNYAYEILNDDSVVITNYNGGEKNVMIPSEIDGKKVTKIGYGAFAECKSIETLVIPTTVTAIDSYAFSQCSQITSVEIPNTVLSMGRYAFAGNSKLKSVTVPNKLRSLGYGLFFDCTALEEVFLPDGIQMVGSLAFGQCKSLKKIDLPHTLSSIESNAFSDCVALQEIILPEGMTTLGNSAFSGCLSLMNITIPNTLTGIAQSAFKDCIALKNIVLPGSLSAIGYGAFTGCTSLEEVTIPDNVTYISNAMFSGCSSLKKIVIPNSVEEMGEFVFSGCSALEEVYISDSVKKVGASLFNYCSSLKNVRLSANLGSISSSMFRYCGSLETLVLPNSVTSVGDTAFADCAKLRSVTFSNKITSLSSRILSNSPLAVMSVIEGSDAHTYARKNLLPFRLIGKGINLDKDSLNMKVGDTDFFAAILAPYTILDNTQLSWTSSNPAVVSVDASGNITAKMPGTATITAQNSNELSASAVVTVDDKVIPITNISLNYETLTMKKDTSLGLRATVDPSNTTMNKKLLWESDNTEIATVSSTGTIFARAPGTTTIRVKTSNGLYAEVVITVISEIQSVSLNQTAIALDVGVKQILRATINPSDTTDSKDVTWVSSNTKVATVNQTGEVTALVPGTATITVKTLNGRRAECKITVLEPEVNNPIQSVTLNKTAENLVEGTKLTLIATINPADTTEDKTLTWKSSDSAVASVESGVVTAKAAGTAIITVATSNGKTATCTIKVSRKVIEIESVTLNETSMSLEEEKEATLSATINPSNTTEDKTLVWTTSNPLVATVTNGKVKALKAGTAIITVTTSNGKTATCTIKVSRKVIEIESVTLNETSMSLEEETEATLSATINPSNTTEDKTLVWTTSNPLVATVTNGKVKALKAGTATIMVATSNGKTATCTIKVSRKVIEIESVTLNETSMSLEEEKEATLSATINPSNTTEDKTLVWTTSNPLVATVTNGKVKALKAGTATITVTTSNGKKATCLVTVTKKPLPIEKVTLNVTSAKLKVDKSLQLIATITPLDTTDSKTLTWTSSKDSVAKVSASGLVTAVHDGVAVITVTTSNGLSAECKVTVYSVNKEALKSKIEAAKSKVQSTYTKDSYALLVSELNLAEELYANDDAQQVDVDAMIIRLQAAIDALIVNATTTQIDQLKNLLLDCKEYEGNFSEAEFSIMKGLIATGDALLSKGEDNIASANVAELIGKLQLEKSHLDLSEVKNRLLKLIDMANAILEGDLSDIDGQYIADLRKAVSDAQVLIDTNSTDKIAIISATAELKAAISNCEQDVTKIHLENMLALCKIYNQEEYTEESWNKLAAIMDKASALLDDGRATQASIDECYLELTEGLLGLNLKVNKSMLKYNVESAKTILKNKADYVSSTIVGLDELVEEAQALIARKDATTNQVNDMNSKLLKAIMKARLKEN